MVPRRRYFIVIGVTCFLIMPLLIFIKSRSQNVKSSNQPPDLESRLQRLTTHFEFERSDWAQRFLEYQAVLARRCGRRGKIVILVLCRDESAEQCQKNHSIAQQSIACYLRSKSFSNNYAYKFVDVNNDKRVLEECQHKLPKFRRHCAAAIYASDADWTLVLEPDVGVVNPDHCIEEYIDDQVDLIFYERFANWQISSGTYLVRNTTRAIQFLRHLADQESVTQEMFDGDAATLQMHLLRVALPDAAPEVRTCERFFRDAKSYDTFMALVICVKIALGANRVFPLAGVRILRRAHGWMRDSALTEYKWCERDFMLDGLSPKEGRVLPFSANFTLEKCQIGSMSLPMTHQGWHWRHELSVHVDEIRARLAYLEQSEEFLAENVPQQSRIHPYLIEPDVVECHPFCDNETWALSVG